MSRQYTLIFAEHRQLGFPRGTYTVRVEEGGTYRNRSSGREFTIKRLSESGECEVSYTEKDAADHLPNEYERVERLGVLEAVGETPEALVDVDLRDPDATLPDGPTVAGVDA